MKTLLRSAAGAAGAPIRLALLLPIRAWRLVSPAFGQRCRYYPSCSAYAEEAIRERGAFTGAALALWRVLRCNPFAAGGIDRVPARRRSRLGRVEGSYDGVIQSPGRPR
ncbi:MAG: membrane protein insertion efficiency factor YidD [Actinomycetota bacterium]